MSRTAQIGVKAPGRLGSTWINLTYNYWSDNTWYCPSPGNIGASSGTWYIGRTISDLLSLEKGGQLIATGAGIAVADLTCYPFNEDFKGLVGTFRCYSKSAAWYMGTYADLGVNEVLNCSYWYNKV